MEKKWLFIGAFIILIIYLLMLKLLFNSEVLNMNDFSQVTNPSYIFSNDELPKNKYNALSGNPDIAWYLSQYYGFTEDEVFEWYIIGAENGDERSKYALAILFINYNYEPSIRGIFWLYILAKNNDQNAEDWLEYLGYNIDTASPPDDNYFFNNYTEIYESEIVEYKMSALKGNRKAALLLGKYYSKISVDKNFSEYWYRIGAQNGDLECKYIFGEILLGKDNEFDKARGEFWLRQAEESGFKSFK